MVFLLAAAVYSNTLGAGFTWDDHRLIIVNKHIDDLDYIRYMLLERKLWRPIKRISLMIDYALWGRERAAGYHATNMMLHASVCLALYFVVLRLGRSRRLAGTAAMLFAVHPVHVESVANISHRKESLALVFYLLAFLAYLRAADRSSAEGSEENGRPPGVIRPAVLGYLFLVFFFYLLAMLSKEVAAVMLPALIVVYELAVQSGERRQRLRRLAVFLAPFVVVLAIFFLRGYLGNLHERFSAEQIDWVTGGQSASYGIALLASLKAFGLMLWLCLWPWPLYLDRAFQVPSGPMEAGVALGLVALVVYVAAVTLAVRRRNRIAVFALAWYGLNLAPVINLVPLTHWWAAERFLYAPSLGVSLLAALGLERLWRRGGGGTVRQKLLAPAGVLFAVLLVCHAVLTVKQNGYWKNSWSLFQHTLKYNPESYRALLGIGLEYYNDGDYETAEPYFRRSIELNYNYPDVHYGLALLLHFDKRYKEAIEEAEIYAEMKPKDPEPYIMMGDAWVFLGDLDKAIEAFRTAVEKDPEHPIGWRNLGTALLNAGRPEEAEQALLRALELERSEQALIQYGQVLYRQRRLEELAKLYTEIVALDPDNPKVSNSLSNVLKWLGRYPEAAREMERSLALDPDQPEIRESLQKLKQMGY
jgi:tetratricopeptide (TPR) repeat protein